MNDTKLRAMVDEMVERDREIERLDKLQKADKLLMAAEAASRADEHTEIEGGGWSWRAEGNSGCAVIVSQPKPTLKANVAGEGKTIEKVRAAAGNFFASLFEQAPSYKPVANFREEAVRLLGKAAGKLIKLVTTESTPRVSFETKKAEG